MDKIRWRDLQRWPYTDIEQVLPVAITHDSQTKLVLLQLQTYNKLVAGYHDSSPLSSDSQASLRVEEEEG